MTFPTVPPSPPTERPQPPHRSDRFFAWVAGLGVARSDGWIGGVAAGVASRLRIDPLIVRGVLVVATLFGLPMILLYAVAWALLPDPEGRIHLRELLRGRFEPAQLGILAGFLIGMLSITPTVGPFLVERIVNPYSFQTFGPSPFGVLLFLVGLVLVGILLALIVRAARRTPGGALQRMASAAEAPPFPSAPAGHSGAAETAEIREEDAGAEGESPASSPASEQMPSDAEEIPSDAEELETWRAQHAAWQQQDQAWRTAQQDAERSARDQARAERQAAAAAFAAEASARRRIRRSSNPRASAAYVIALIGMALAVAAAVWLLSQHPDAVTGALALFSAALVLAFGMIIGGAARRRSGFLALVTVATLTAGLITGAAGTLGDVRFGDTYLSNSSGATSIRQPFGSTGIVLANMEGVDSHPVTVHKGSGYTEVYVSDGVELQLTATVGEDATVQWSKTEYDAKGDVGDSADGSFTGVRLTDGRTLYRETLRSTFDPLAAPSDTARGVITVPVTITQDSGQIHVIYSTRHDEEAAK